ncbi:hypothetical protein [Cyanobium sp. ULC065]
MARSRSSQGEVVDWRRQLIDNQVVWSPCPSSRGYLPILERSPLLQQAHQRLGASQIAGAEQNDHPITNPLKAGHLAELREIIDAGIRAGVGGEHDSLLQQDADAVGH